MTADVIRRLLDELGGGDDPELWLLAVARIETDVAALMGVPHPPRRLLLRVCRVPSRTSEVHPDSAAHFRLCWTRDRKSDGWTFAGASPRYPRKRGSYSATVCVPSGTRRLAVATVTVLWRPRYPWAEPEDTEIGRQFYDFARDHDGDWHHRGTRTR